MHLDFPTPKAASKPCKREKNRDRRTIKGL